MRKAFRRAVIAGILAGLAYAIWRALQARVPAPASKVGWETAPFPFPPAPRPSAASTEPTTAASPEPAPAWVEPVEGACPATHPVKAKLSSGIFHVPGGQNYERTRPDRCYRDAQAAQADGLRPSQR
jgi:hypothetical protein